jgi:hypothetical protein
VRDAAVNPNGFEPQKRHIMTSAYMLTGPH